jgi:hypothetical protein
MEHFPISAARISADHRHFKSEIHRIYSDILSATFTITGDQSSCPNRKGRSSPVGMLVQDGARDLAGLAHAHVPSVTLVSFV